jgi:hypothetical protein
MHEEFAQAQETKEAPSYEEVHSGEEIKGGGSVKAIAILPVRFTIPCSHDRLCEPYGSTETLHHGARF